VLVSSFYGPRFGAEDYSEEGVPTIRTTDMDFRGGINLADSPRIALSPEQLSRFGLQDGDLLVTRTGATIGKCALYTSAMGPALPSAYLIRFRLNKSLMEPRFALTFFMAPTGQSQLLGGSTAVAQPNVNATAISAFKLQLPSLGEQKEIVRRVEQLFTLADQLEARYAKAQTHVDNLTQSILAKAFRGELVPQDPNDEPATALLARIRSSVNDAESPRAEKPRRSHKICT
jgi:type I restriction enzyme S subunit